MIHYIALVMSITLNALGLVLLKRHAVTLVSIEAGGTEFDRIRRLLDPVFLLAIALYGLAAISWTIALFGVDLIVAYPTLASTYVFIGLVAPRLFQEEISGSRWLGMGTICIGVVLVNL